MEKLRLFKIEGKSQKITYIETNRVKEGVLCDVYSFEDDMDKDLAIISIKPESCTPLQRILKGERTLEGYLSGEGKLKITYANGKHKVFHLDESKSGFFVDLKVGDMMQWFAGGSQLTVFEVCYPPYEDGRFENID